MQFNLPKAPPAGKYTATITKVEEDPWGAMIVTWSVSAEEKEWEVPHEMVKEDYTTLVVELGFAADVAVTVLVGTKAGIDMGTRGGRKSAFIKEVVPASS